MPFLWCAIKSFLLVKHTLKGMKQQLCTKKSVERKKIRENENNSLTNSAKERELKCAMF